MARTTSTLYSPPVGQRLIVKDTENDEEVFVSTLSVRDKTPFKHRTPKNTPKGQEYFYVKRKIAGEWVFIKMLNSLLRTSCSSEDGRYVFEGKLPSGNVLPCGKGKSENKPKRVTAVPAEPQETNINFISEILEDD